MDCYLNLQNNLSYKVPILVISFNRPLHTQQVLNQVRNTKPKKLYFFNDGPRKDNPFDLEKCQVIRSYIKNIDWDCEIKTMFQKDNLGCGLGPVKAINWFFKNEEEGIILEDDCLPDLSFFRYCEILLDKFRDDTRIFAIGGRNELGTYKDKKYSYYFFYEGLLGWATWRRAWKHFDYHIKDFGNEKLMEKFHNFYNNDPRLFLPVEKGCEKFLSDPDWGVWDYQWSFTRAINEGFVIIPSRNLVCNTGFGPEATHTTEKKSKRGKVKVYQMKFPLIHNDNVNINWDLANKYLKFYKHSKIILLYRYIKRIFKKIA